MTVVANILMSTSLSLGGRLGYLFELKNIRRSVSCPDNGFHEFSWKMTLIRALLSLVVMINSDNDFASGVSLLQIADGFSRLTQ